MYAHENELSLIQREAGKAKEMIEDIQDIYGFETGGAFFTESELKKIGFEKSRISWKLRIIFDSLDRIGEIVDGVDAEEEAARKAVGA